MKFSICNIIVSVLFIYAAECADPVPGPAVVVTKGEVWPKPWQQIKLAGYFLFTPDSFTFELSSTENNCSLLQNVLDVYKKIIQDEQAGRVTTSLENQLSDDNLGNLDSLKVTLTQPCSDNDYPSLEADESYTLSVTNKTSEIKSSTVWGVIKGLETFSQLIFLETDDDPLTLRIQATEINDRPRFSHRGLLVDTARHYIPLKQIYEIIDGLACNKMNVFHWHIVDDQSFPYVSAKFPELSERGAYTPREIYKIEDIKNVIEYARLRGIRVIPEFDTPGHTRSWGLSHSELICNYQGMYGPMDPSKNSTYEFLNDIFGEVRQVFKDNYIHLGGDEVDFTCWTINPSIRQFMAEQGLYSTSDYMNYYGQKVINTVDALNFSSIVWEEMFFNGVKLSNDSVVQIWRNWFGQYWTTHIRTVTAAGKKAILSACWYLDGLSQTWEDFYNCDPLNFMGSEEQKKLVIGGEACMWAEKINVFNVVSHIFPRTSATAERLWSEQFDDKYDEKAKRLEEHACRMNRRGISAGPPNGPGFCN